MIYFTTNEMELARKINNEEELLNFVPDIVKDILINPEWYKDLKCEIKLIDTNKDEREVIEHEIGELSQEASKRIIKTILDNINDYERYHVRYSSFRWNDNHVLNIKLIRGRYLLNVN